MREGSGDDQTLEPVDLANRGDQDAVLLCTVGVHRLVVPDAGHELVRQAQTGTTHVATVDAADRAVALLNGLADRARVE